MISTQRLLLITIFINFLLVMSNEMYFGTLDTSKVNGLISQNIAKLTGDRLYMEKSNPETQTTILDRTFGDQRAGGQAITNWLKGLDVITYDEGMTSFERMIIMGLGIFRIFFGLLLLMELYFIFFNKKTGG